MVCFNYHTLQVLNLIGTVTYKFSLSNLLYFYKSSWISCGFTIKCLQSIYLNHTSKRISGQFLYFGVWRYVQEYTKAWKLTSKKHDLQNETECDIGYDLWLQTVSNKQRKFVTSLIIYKNRAMKRINGTNSKSNRIKKEYIIYRVWGKSAQSKYFVSCSSFIP